MKDGNDAVLGTLKQGLQTCLFLLEDCRLDLTQHIIRLTEEIEQLRAKIAKYEQ